MRFRSTGLLICLGLLGPTSPWCVAATLSVQPLTVMPGSMGTVVVEGAAANESTFGVTILVELVPQGGTAGTVTFTQAPPTDIGLAGHPWLGSGGFTPFDTDSTGSPTLNGSVHDNGTFVAAPVTYDGLLTGFPVVASANAFGTWDVVLSTSSGDSSWEGLSTTLTPATITVPNIGDVPTASIWALLILAESIAAAATVMLFPGVALTPSPKRTFRNRLLR